MPISQKPNTDTLNTLTVEQERELYFKGYTDGMTDGMKIELKRIMSLAIPLAGADGGAIEGLWLTPKAIEEINA